eukprot:TRINITY_DN716_c0_g7_i1.p1 TRINITY_DN716_c0_g7~~TRINITY_DN716_c0_g7_i1.p1  ORF type:complete len:226 (-),score=26.83 TRINITY_DN716_c0_g7_i1:71-748(-)
MIPNRSEHDFLFKVVLIGDSAVGKSSILIRFTDNTFTEYYKNTIGVDFKIKSLQLDNRLVKLQIWDTAGQEQFKTITSSYYKGAHGFLLCFDLTRQKTFNNVSKWMEEINKYVEPTLPKLLVGNKADLPEKREVQRDEVMTFAQTHGLNYVEVSAKTGDKVDEIFRVLSKEMIQGVEDSRLNPTLASTMNSNRRQILTSTKIDLHRNQTHYSDRPRKTNNNSCCQ